MRQQRITTSQQEIYLIYLSDHQDFAASKISTDAKEKTSDEDFVENWTELTNLLNATLGPKKTIEEWKTVFLHWKNQLKTRAKKLKTVQESTSQESNEAKLALQKLTDVEKRALKLWKEDSQDKDIASILNEIEKKDITITPISKKRKSSTEPNVISVTQIKPPTSSPSTHNSVSSVPFPIQLPITIKPKQPRDELSDFLTIKSEPFEAETKRSSIEFRPVRDIQMHEIMDWAKSYNVSDPAVDALLNVLKIKRIKTEKQESTNNRPAEARKFHLNQRELIDIIISLVPLYFRNLWSVQQNVCSSGSNGKSSSSKNLNAGT